MQIGNIPSKYTKTSRDLRQRCVFSADIFNQCSEATRRKLEVLMGFIIWGNDVDDSVDGGKKTAGNHDKVVKESEQNILTN